MSGMDKIVVCDQSHSLDDFMPLPDANGAGTSGENRVVTLRSRIWQKRSYFNRLCVGMVRSEGGRICCDIKGLPEWANVESAFRAYWCFSSRVMRVPPDTGWKSPQFGGVYGSGVPIAIKGSFFVLASNSPTIFR